MIKIKQAIIVEGKYDKIKLGSIIDAPIITTDGFAIFKDKQKLRYIQQVAELRGIVIATDSDSAGFLIRSHIKGAVPSDRIINVYMPDLLGRERRKDKPSAEGKLGVEGIPCELILQAFRRAGVTVDDASAEPVAGEITKLDLYEAGLCGGENSKAKRLALLKRLQLPERMSSNALLDALNIFMTREELLALCSTL